MQLDFTYNKLNKAGILSNNRELGKVLVQLEREIAKIINQAKIKYPSDYPARNIYARNTSLKNKIDRVLEEFSDNTLASIDDGIKAQWTLGNDKNDDIIKQVAGYTPLADPKIIESMQGLNLLALDSFITRKQAGLNLSQRVWNIANVQNQELLELYLGSGITQGRSAQKVSQDIRQLLNEPEKLFRRVRDKDGNLVLSAAAKQYHPGRGVYRSSAKNAKRLAANEINMAFHNSDFQRRQKLPFVKGVLVRLSAAHPRQDICFTNWNYKLITPDGWKTLNKISVGDTVLTHKGRYRKVLKIHKSTVYEVNKTEISFKNSYDSRSKTYKIAATDNHPFLINGEWAPISKIKIGDKVKMLAGKCKWCGKVIPFDRDYCSKSCASKQTAKGQWKNEKHRESVSKKAKKRCKGGIPYFKEWTDSGKNINNLINPETQKKAHARSKITMAVKAKNGTHPFQQIENRIKGNQSLARNRNNSFIERKMEWLLKEKGIDYEHSYMFMRNEMRSNGNGEQKRFYVIDFVIPEHKIAIECDGEYWHKDRKIADKIRQSEIEKEGFTFLRFPGEQIRNNLKSCSESIDRLMMNHKREYKFMEIEITNMRHYTQSQITPITKWNFEIEEDNSYVINGFVVHNCDALKGAYPRGFIFEGWHALCFCYTTTLLASRSEVIQFLKTGEIDKRQRVRSIPRVAKTYIKKNGEKLQGLKHKPYFLRKNFTTDLKLKKKVLQRSD